MVTPLGGSRPLVAMVEHKKWEERLIVFVTLESRVFHSGEKR